MSIEHITLIQPTLGTEPYVLLIAELDEDGGLSFRVHAGGGIASHEDIKAALVLALSAHGPLTDEEREQLGAAS